MEGKRWWHRALKTKRRDKTCVGRRRRRNTERIVLMVREREKKREREH